MTYNGYPDRDAFHAAMRAEWDRRREESIAFQLDSRVGAGVDPFAGVQARACAACGAEAGEPCFPLCVGKAAQLGRIFPDDQDGELGRRLAVEESRIFGA